MCRDCKAHAIRATTQMPASRAPPGLAPSSIPVTEIRDGDTLVFRACRSADLEDHERSKAVITERLLPTKVRILFMGYAENCELIHVIRPAPKVETKAPDLDPATAEADLKAAGLA